MDHKNMLRHPKQQRSRERVQRIIDATLSVLEQEGVKALSTRSIATRAEIPVSSVYQYFPNKEAILVAVYEDYLEVVREAYDKADTPENRTLPKREFFSQLISKLWAAEGRNNIDAEFETALGLYPQLMAIDRAHEDWIAERIVKSLVQLGSDWPKPKLKRMAYFLYQSNSTLWFYRSRHNPPKKEAREWALASLLAVFEKCFE